MKTLNENDADRRYFAHRVNLYNPHAAAGWCVILPAVFGALLYAYNWKQLGELERAKEQLYWAGVFAILTLVGLIFPSSGSFWIYILTLVAWYYLSAEYQIRVIREEYNEIYNAIDMTTPVMVGLCYVPLEFFLC